MNQFNLIVGGKTGIAHLKLVMDISTFTSTKIMNTEIKITIKNVKAK